MFTSKYPSEHGIHETAVTKMPQLFGAMKTLGSETFVQRLRGAGYNTIGFSANPEISSGSGFDSGFSSFITVDDIGMLPWEHDLVRQRGVSGMDRWKAAAELLKKGKVSELVQLYRLLKKIEARQKASGYPTVKGGERITRNIVDGSFERPFFLFLNFMEMHEPYLAEELPKVFPRSVEDLLGQKRISEALMQRIRREYYRTTSIIDEFLGAIVSYLKKNDVYDESIIVLTSDHGQALKERGFYGHGIVLYDEIVEIPLIVKYPGNKTISPGPGYQSLVDIPLLVERYLEDNSVIDITRRAAFSEGYGLQNSLPTSLMRVPNSVIEAYDAPRKAIYMDRYKLVVNGRTGKTEEFARGKEPLNPSEHTSQVTRLVNELRLFVGTEHFNLDAAMA